MRCVQCTNELTKVSELTKVGYCENPKCPNYKLLQGGI